MPLRYEPTLVIGVDDGGKMEGLMKQVQFWLNETQPQVLPIVRIGIADKEKKLRDTSGNLIKGSLTEGIKYWLDEIVEAENLSKVRNAGFELPSELLVRRIVVAVDSQTDWQLTQTVLETLSQILQERRQRNEPTVNLLVAVITQSDGAPSQNFQALHDWLSQNAENFGSVNLLVLDRYRSDGSAIDPAQLPLVLTFILLVALTPYESTEHWLFRSPTSNQPTTLTVGLGIVYVPLPDIADAAAKWLCHQLSQQALRKEVDEKFLQERWEEVKDALDEAKLWQGIFRGLSDYGIGAKVTEEGEFAIELPEGMVRLDLTAIPWDKWAERIADWEAKWMLMLEEFWLPKIQEGANETQRETAEKLSRVLDKCVENGVAVKETVERLMGKTLEHLSDWKSLKTPKGVKRASADLQRLDQALRQVPHPYAIAARILLLGTVVAYFTFVFARWGWLSGFLANWLRNFLPFVEPWMVPTFIGLLGLIAILRMVWNGWRTYDEAVQRVESIKEGCIRAVAEEIKSILRQAGLNALEQFHQNFEGWAKRTTEDNREVAKNIETQRQEWEASFKSFKAADYPLVRSCVQKWEQLEPVFLKAVIGRPYDELWRKLLKEAQLNSWEQWVHRWIDRSAAELLEQRARDMWVSQLKGEEVRQLGTYLSEDELEKMLDGCYGEGERFLWQKVQPGTETLWALLPKGETDMESKGVEVLNRRYGSQRGWQKILLPGIIGYLRVAEAQI